MTRILTWLTMLLVGAVVVVLATYLVLIARALLHADRNLAKLIGGLEATREHTLPLADHLEAVNQAAGTLKDRLSAVDRTLVEMLGGEAKH